MRMGACGRSPVPERPFLNTILFVCRANVCRSPMAEAIFDTLAEDAGLPFRSQSAGIAVPDGALVAPRVVDTLEEIGITVDPLHTARQIDEAMVRDADLVLTMTTQQADRLRWLFGEQVGKIHGLAEYAGKGFGTDVADPHGHTVTAYRASALQVLGFIRTLVSRLGERQLPAGTVPGGRREGSSPADEDRRQPAARAKRTDARRQPAERRVRRGHA